MPIYYGDYALINVQTGAVAVHELPFGLRVATGIAAPAAAPGTKTFAGKARCKADTFATLGYSRNLDGFLGARATARCDLDTGRVTIDEFLKCKVSTPRSELSTFAPQAITFVGSSAYTAALSAGVSITAPAHAVGDVLIVIGGGGASLINASSGWNTPPSGGVNSTNQGAAYLITPFWRIADGTANDNITLTPFTTNATNPIFAQMFVYRNVDTVNGPFATWNPSSRTASFPFWTAPTGGSTGSGARNVAMPVGADTAVPGTSVYGTTLWQKAHSLVFVVYGDDELITPTLTDGGGNTVPEAATFPYTLDVHTNTTLGGGNALSAFRFANATGPQIDGYAAAGSLAVSNSAATATLWAVETNLRPKGITPNVTVWLDGVLQARTTATCNLTRVAGVSSDFLVGTLTCRSTATADLFTLPGKMLDGILQCHASLFGTLTDPHPFDVTLRNRCVAVCTLHIGTAHHPAGLLTAKASAFAILTTNYMRSLLACHASAACVLAVNVKLSSAMQARSSVSAALTVLRAFAANAACHSTATARLTLPMQGVLRCRSTANADARVQRQFSGTAVARSSTSVKLFVGRYFSAFAGAHSTASADLDAPRLLAAHLLSRSTASVTLALDHRLAGTLHCRCTAHLVLTLAYPVEAPVGTEITVSPDSASEVDRSSVQVESAHDAAYVETDE